MKTWNTIAKLLTALAAVAGAVYIIATYGEQMVAWCKKALESLPKCPMCEKDDDDADIEVEITVEEPAAEEAEEVPVAEDAPAQEATAAENEPVADETDFAE